MADDAFALSPISARPMQPGDADYEAIREAFVETSRGRWFLNEYTKRNRNSDTRMVLDAVARIEETIAKAQEATAAPAEILAQVRPLIAQARAQVDVALTLDPVAEALAGARKGSRIIREISWSLRETGTDSRICDILDGQLARIDQLADVVVDDNRRAAVLAAFDLLRRNIDAIDGTHAAETTSDDAADGPATASASADDVTAADAAVPAIDAHVTPTLTETVADRAPVSPFGDAPAIAGSSDSAFGAAADDEDDDDGFPRAGFDPEVVSPDAVELGDDDEMNFAGDVEFTPTEADIAADDAVLDLVASEMAASDDVAFDDVSDSSAPEQAVSDTDVPLADSTDPTLMATPAPVAPLQPSLGEALLANGFLRQPPASDPLAPFRRMSQAEKIAFFS